MGNPKKLKWTVFFIIKSAGVASIREVIQMVNEIRSIPANNQVRIVLCVNFIKDHLKALLTGDESKLPVKSKEVLTTMFFSLVENNGEDNFKTKLKLIDERKDFDITDPRWLKQFFREVVLLPNEASQYMLITWDHGRFYGIFRDEPESDPEDTPAPENKNPFKGVDPSQFKLNPDAKVLTMKELAQAIKWAFPRKSIDVMVMVNCYMQSLDAGFALRKRVKYLVAPEGFIYLDGYNYPLIFHVLLHNPDISPEELAKLIVRSFPSKVYADGHMIGVRKKSLAALFAADLQYYTTFVEMVDKLVEALLKRIPELKKILEEAKANSFVIIDTYDFFSFISFLEYKDIFINDALAASLVLSLREIVIIESFVGNSISIKAPNDVINNPSGFTVFIPNDLPSNNDKPVGMDDPFQTEFYKKTKWHLLIEKLLSA